MQKRQRRVADQPALPVRQAGGWQVAGKGGDNFPDGNHFPRCPDK
ncbi:MAG: hypothetical protein R6V32_03420 [Bacteroidales bacterium]